MAPPPSRPDRPRSRRSATRPTRAEERDAVAERRSRALEEPLAIRAREGAPYPLLEVRNPLHGTAYLVMLPSFPAREAELCTCTDFARRGLGTCKHIEAGYRWRQAHRPEPPAEPPAPAESRWKEIDRRVASPGAGPDSLRLRRAGRVLFEPGA
jgi:hypothetical protein